jgi:hypothetical protein
MGYISLKGLGEWIESIMPAGFDVPIVPGEFIPVVPGRLVILLPTGGPGDFMERAFDRTSFSVHTRGEQLEYASGEALAAQVDQAIMAVQPSQLLIGGVYVNDISRLGGPPRFQGWDEAKRTNFIASYVVQHAL